MRRAVDVEAIAGEVMAVRGTGGSLAPFTTRYPGFDAAAAYRVAALVRERAGGRVVGRKLGFTNRAVWREPPMWGWMYESTVREGADATLALQGFAEPRLEPEIVFGLAAPPVPGMDETALIGCIDWAAHGFEIVESIFPGWDFSGADAIAAGALHGALFIGPRHVIGADATDWVHALASFEITLSCDGVEADRGHAGNVMGGPLRALGHLVSMLAADPGAPPLAAGEIVSTGTLTRALPIEPGQTWSTTPRRIGLDGMRLRACRRPFPPLAFEKSSF